MDRSQSVPKDWATRLVLGLRVMLAACTAVATLAVLTQEPGRPDLRWLLAVLALSLFLVTIVEPRMVRRFESRTGGTPGDESRGNPGVHEEADGQVAIMESRGESEDETQMKLRQLVSHRADYVYTVSHELRTPLTSIQGFAQLITRDEVPTCKSSEYARIILSEAERLARIVDDIIVLTKMESSLLDLKRDAVEVSELIGNVVDRLSPPRGPDNLTVKMSSQLPTIRGDRLRLEQLLESIVLDAISRADQESAIALAAEDAGAGVRICLTYEASPSQATRISRAFGGLWDSESDGMATRLGRGDLDIYVARNLVEAQGGSISVESPAEGKLQVSITLPC